MKIYVKNMACQSCKLYVSDALEELGISQFKVELGEIDTKEDVSDDEKEKLNRQLKRAGMELLEKKRGVIIEKMKKFMIDYVNADQVPEIKFSILLSKELDHNYAYLANLFSEIEATTIKHYIIALKIERIKELIIFEEDTLSQISDKLNYSNVANLSNQFKKMTGMTPTHFKALKERRRLTIQEI